MVHVPDAALGKNRVSFTGQWDQLTLFPQGWCSVVEDSTKIRGGTVQNQHQFWWFIHYFCSGKVTNFAKGACQKPIPIRIWPMIRKPFLKEDKAVKRL